MDTLVIATKNPGKMLEFKELLGDIPYEIVSLKDFPPIQIEESGKSFEENAMIKAKAVAAATGLTALGDDSGLEVKALGGKPGIYTTRYAGEGATDIEKIKKLLRELKDVPWEQRQARFVCSLALAFPEGETFIEHGFCEGLIATELRGEHGFGYDPIFYLPQYGMTFAELDHTEKNKISHRAQAAKKIKIHLMSRGHRTV